MCNSNKKKALLGENVNVSDFDAVSLYPSAQKRIYYPMGVCKTMTKSDIKFYNDHKNLFNIKEEQDSQDQRSLYVEVKIFKTKDTISRDFPLISSVNQEGVRIFENEPTDEPYFMDHI